MAINESRTKRKCPNGYSQASFEAFEEEVPHRFDHALHHLKKLSAIGPRPTGSVKEYQAAAYVRSFFQSLGLETLEDSFFCNPSMFRPHLMIFLGIVAMGALPIWLMAWGLGTLGFILASLGCFLAFKFYSDLLEAKRTWLHRVLPKASCRNIMAKIPSRKKTKSRIVLLSHLDTALCSPIFHEKMVRSLKTNIWLNRLLILTLGVLYFISGLSGFWLPYYLALLGSLYILGTIFVLLYSEIFCPSSPGVNDNASGVAGVLALAQTLTKNPLQHSEVWCVCLGAEETGTHGARELLARYAPELKQSYVINLDSISAGKPRYLVNEGYAKEYKADADLVNLMERYSARNPERQWMPMAIKGSGGFTDATPLLRNGCHAISIIATNEEGYIPNWHTLHDTFENIVPQTLFNILETVDEILIDLDRDLHSFQRFPQVPRNEILFRRRKLRLRRKAFLREKPNYKILTHHQLKAGKGKLLDYVWPNFDQEASNVFQTSKFLEANSLSCRAPNGFIVLEDKPHNPVVMIPYFIFYELLDDGIMSQRERKFFSFIKKKTLSFGFSLLPGARTLYLGTPFSQPNYQFFIRQDQDHQNFWMEHEDLIPIYKKALKKLQWIHRTMVTSHFNFARDPKNDFLFKSLEFEPYVTWPENYLDFTKIHKRLRDRLRESIAECDERIGQFEDNLEQLKVQESKLLQALESTPEIKIQAEEKHLLIAEEEEQLLHAADAQNRIDHLMKNLESGKYLDALKKKDILLLAQREIHYFDYTKLPRKVRSLIARLYDVKICLKESQSQTNKLSHKLKKNNDKVKTILAKSLSNKYQGVLPEEEEDKIKFFAERQAEMDPEGPLPAEWVDITKEDVLRRLDDFRNALKARDSVRLVLEEVARNHQELNEGFKVHKEELRSSCGEYMFQDLSNLLKAEQKNRESHVIAKRIEEERRVFQARKDPLERLEKESPERAKIFKAMDASLKRRMQAIQKLGITEGWKSLPEDARKLLKKLAAVRQDLHKSDNQLRETRRNRRQIEFDLSQKEFDLFQGTLIPTFDDYVESLGVNDRNAMRRNLKHIQATEAEYPVEILKNPEDIINLSNEIFLAYSAQYKSNKVQWLKMTSQYFRELAKIPGTEVVVCWHLKGLTEKKFAGFIINLDGRFNNRMGIMPEYQKGNDLETESNHFVYFRLTLKNIQANLEHGGMGMYIAQTTYQAKKRLGFEIFPLVNYRKNTAWFGIRIINNYSYLRVMSGIRDPKILFQY